MECSICKCSASYTNGVFHIQMECSIYKWSTPYMLFHWRWCLVQGTTERQKVGKSHWEAGCWVDLHAVQ